MDFARPFQNIYLALLNNVVTCLELCYNKRKFLHERNDIHLSNPLTSARWLWDHEKGAFNTYLVFQKAFSISRINPDRQYTLSISADSQYEVFLNGCFIGSGQYPDYESYKVYDTYDIGHRLQIGENCLIIHAYWQGESSSVYKQAAAGVIFALCEDDGILALSDETTYCAEYTNYKSGDVVKFSPQLSYSFEYDARAALPTFKPADIVDKPAVLYPRPIKPLDILPEQSATLLSQGVFIDTNPTASLGQRLQYAFLAYQDYSAFNTQTSSVTLPAPDGLHFSTASDAIPSDGIYLLVDLLENSAGYLTLDIDLPKDSLVLMGFGEHLEDLRVRSYVGGRNFCASYYGKQGRNRFIHRFKRAGLRYLQLFVYSHSFTLYYAGIQPAVYPVSTVPQFRCEDSLHNKIYDVCVKTLRLCMHEHYEDCPWREQALYAMDSRNQMLCGYYTFGEYDFAKSSLRLMALSIRDDDLLELCSPGEVGVTIPSFSAIFVTALHEYLQHSGDRDFVREVLPAARRIVDGFIRRINPDSGLVPCYTETGYWNFYEWQQGLDGGSIFRDAQLSVSYDAPLNAFISMAMQSLSSIYTILQVTDAQYYSKVSQRLNHAMNDAFWDADKAVYASYLIDGYITHTCELTQSLMAYCGACPPDKLPFILEAIACKRLLPVTLSHSIFKYEALLQLPKYEKQVFEEIAEIWGSMLFQGATTFWETEMGSKDFEHAGSLCHGWSAIPAYLYYRYGLGLKVTSPGFAAYEITPAQNGLHGCRGVVQTPNKTLTIGKDV